MTNVRGPGAELGGDRSDSASQADAPSYRAAGVDLDGAKAVKDRIGRLAAGTYGAEVLEGVGGFGALYRLSGYDDPVLVASTDGVGTKLKLAIATGMYETIGEDLVTACVNDIIVTGARPLFFLDYIATGALAPLVVEALVKGMAAACREVECSLIGGETAQMPGLYAPGEFDLAGFVVGAVERRSILDPSAISQGDVLIGLPSNGLHTNGYSLVRDALGLDGDPGQLAVHHPELDATLGQALMAPHTPYYRAVQEALPSLKGMAHITGGGLVENLPRSLPDGLAARLDRTTWAVPPIFTFLQERSNVDEAEMYRVFNMGLGMVLICDPAQAAAVEALVPEATVVGQVVVAEGGRRVVL